VLGIDRFDASAPGPEVYARLGLTPDRLADLAVAITRAPGG